VARTRRIVWAAQRYNIRKQWRKQAILVVPASVAMWFLLPNADTAWKFGIAAAYAVVLPSIYAVRLSYYIHKTARLLHSRTSDEATLSLTDDEFILATSQSIVRRKWSAVKSVDQDVDFLLLRSTDKTVLALVCGRCAGPQSFAELRMFLVGRGLLPQAYKIKI
jgi:hypothetical protein